MNILGGFGTFLRCGIGLTSLKLMADGGNKLNKFFFGIAPHGFGNGTLAHFPGCSMLGNLSVYLESLCSADFFFMSENLDLRLYSYPILIKWIVDALIL